eukprot:4338416-Karenia_brevis.AAC.1
MMTSIDVPKKDFQIGLKKFQKFGVPFVNMWGPSKMCRVRSMSNYASTAKKLGSDINHEQGR